MDQYVVFISDSDEDRWEQLTAAEKQAVYDVDLAFGNALAERGGRITGGAELSHSREARVVRRGTRLVTEGPFAETSEVLNGFYLVESPSLEVLLEVVQGLLAAHEVVEVRRTVSGG